MKTEKRVSRFVLCIRNNGSDDLEPRKLYEVLPDPAAVRKGCLRVVDESGEDYLYPAEYFAPVRLPAAVAQELVTPSKSALPPTAGARHRSEGARLRVVRG